MDGREEHLRHSTADETAAAAFITNDLGACTDAATLNSDAAVADGMGGANQPPLASVIPAAAAAMSGTRSPDRNGGGAPGGGGGGGGGAGGHVSSHARRRHYRKRALSGANSAGGLCNGDYGIGVPVGGGRLEAGNLSGASFMMNASTIGSHIMNSGAENSIVSFGLNFNFDGASSPSNSDSGGKGGGDAGSSGEDDNNGGGNSNGNNHNGNAAGGMDGALDAGAVGEEGKKKKKKKKAHHPRDEASKSSPPSPADGVKNRKGGVGEGKKKKGPSVKFGPECTTGANAAAASASAALAAANAVAASNANANNGGDGSSSTSSSGSDSSTNDATNEDSGGSNSGGDGSSGGKSTVSSLTTSSNQEWMATNESAARAAEAEGAAVAAAAAKNSSGRGESTRGGKAPGEGMSDGNATAAKKMDPLSGKKRKKTTVNSNGAKKNKSADEDDGYKTDEEQWGGNRHNAEGSDCQPLNPAGVATHKGALEASPKKSSEGPPMMKQARFSMDQHPSSHHHYPGGHPENVQSADASAQPLSSLSGSDSAGGRCVAVTSSSGGLLSASSATGGNAASSGPSGSSGVQGGVPHVAAPSSLGVVANQRSNKASSATAQLAAGGGAGDTDKRKERNAREKERSCRIARQIDDLRTLLSRGGVIVSKGTKSSVLSEAANYINLLQQQQVQWEMDRQALTQQMQQLAQNQPQNMGGVATNGMVDAQAIPQQLQLQQGGFPGEAGAEGMVMNSLGQQQQQPQQISQQNQNAVSPNDYRFIFNKSSVGMAIASLGGAFVDCNAIFCQLSEYTREEVCAMTIFNVTSRQDLQHAFDLISQMITPALEGGCGGGNNAGGGVGSPGSNAKSDDRSSIVLRGAMKKRTDLGLSITLIRGERGIAKCFCVTLVRILSMEASRPDTVSIQMELPQVWSTKQQKNVGFGASPAYTSG